MDAGGAVFFDILNKVVEGKASICDVFDNDNATSFEAVLRCGVNCDGACGFGAGVGSDPDRIIPIRYSDVTHKLAAEGQRAIH